MRTVLLLLVPGLAMAQFGSFATNGDGSVLYFSSSLVLRDAQDPEHGKIYRVDSSGVKLVFKRERVDPAPAPGGIRLPQSTNSYNMYAVQVSRDGGRLVVSSRGTCIGGPACNTIFVGSVEVGDPTSLNFGVDGFGFLSGNGRHLLVSPFPYSFERSLTLLDLQSGRSSSIADTSIPGTSRRFVADNGSSVVLNSGRLSILHGGLIEQLPESDAAEPTIDAEGRTIVYTHGNARALRVISLPEKRVSEIVRFPNGVYSPMLSADGRRVMFLAPDDAQRSQVWIVDTTGSNPRRITDDAQGVGQATMSDDGKKVWFHSGGGAVFQLDIESRVAVERIGRTAPFSEISVMTPGSVATIRGSGLRNDSIVAAGFPLPLELGGTSVKVKGLAAPILRVTPTEITFQVPWETPAGPDYASVEVEPELNSSPFQTGLIRTGWQVVATSERILRESDDSQYALAVHEDWSSALTAANPARPGEVVHLYGTGFGKVMETPPDGMPAAAGSQSSTVERVRCGRPTSAVPLEVLYSGVAPGILGYYQIDVRVPEDATVPILAIYCSASANLGSGGWLRVGN